ncbi:hypothetical protein BU14_0827s0005 [Porphyra umbilicalis]|uniref:Uncharacterized protein n=1 Tax=Porphyra umbilicalis TaxID=2786 RepID=A0A1X6NP33_PORUM|nr:hypothetical protein BU14_0827s0005 [Porphyra umbilicalis]|eukprot:OSX70256.1 hypothetical protein BU14_0827s0005 [Porphyra umbilicalis]
MTDRANRRCRSTTSATLALLATLAAAVASTAGGASPPTGAPPTLPTAGRRAGRRSACVRLPGCQSEADRFKADYVDGRCLPDARSADVEAAITVHEVFKDVVKAACCTTAAQRTDLDARIAPLEAAGTCAAPYTNRPDYDPAAYACRPLGDCAAVLDAFEADFVAHGCLPRGDEALDAVAKGLLEVLKDVQKAACCTARAQRRRLATELIVLGRASTCPGFAAAARFSVRAPRAVGGGGGGCGAPPPVRLPSQSPTGPPPPSPPVPPPCRPPPARPCRLTGATPVSARPPSAAGAFPTTPPAAPRGACPSAPTCSSSSPAVTAASAP